jgi:hypothetical protein
VPCILNSGLYNEGCEGGFISPYVGLPSSSKALFLRVISQPPLFDKEGLGEILLDKSPLCPTLFSSPFFIGGSACFLLRVGSIIGFKHVQIEKDAANKTLLILEVHNKSPILKNK